MPEDIGRGGRLERVKLVIIGTVGCQKSQEESRYGARVRIPIREYCVFRETICSVRRYGTYSEVGLIAGNGRLHFPIDHPDSAL